MQKLAIVLISTIVLAGCESFSSNVQSKIDKEVTNTFEKLEKEQSLQKDSLSNLNNELSAKNIDSLSRKNITQLNESTLQLCKYIDSGIALMNELNYKDPNNDYIVKSTFFYKGLGDSLFNKFHSTFTIAAMVAPNDITKNRIEMLHRDLLRNEDVDKFKNAYFENTGPLVSAVILYGLKAEILSSEIKILQEINLSKK